MKKLAMTLACGWVSLLAAACSPSTSATAPAESPANHPATTTAAVVISDPTPAPAAAPTADDTQGPRMLTRSMTLGAAPYYGPAPEEAAYGPAPVDPAYYGPTPRIYPRTYTRTYTRPYATNPRLRPLSPNSTVAQPRPPSGTPAVGGNWPAPRSFGPAMLTH